jgi:hypothetical protein
MKRSGWRTLLTAVVTAAALVVSGGAASAATAGGGGHDHGLKPQTFKLLLITGPHGKELVNVLTARGPIRGTGTDTQVSDTRDVFVFPKGTVNVDHQATTNNQPKVNEKTCTATFTEDGTFQLKGGTGKYKHVSGFGRYHLTGFFVLNRKDHKCDVNGEPKLSVIKIKAHGKATLGKHHRK